MHCTKERKYLFFVSFLRDFEVYRPLWFGKLSTNVINFAQIMLESQIMVTYTATFTFILLPPASEHSFSGRFN